MAKTEVLHLLRNPDQCVLQVNGVTLKQVEHFKYLLVAFTSDGRQDEELDTRRGGVEDTRLEAKAKNTKKSKDSPTEDRTSRGQGQVCSRPRTKDTSASALQKKGFQKNFSSDLKKKKEKKGLHKNSSGDLQKKNVFEKNFQALLKLLTTQKIVLSSSRGQGNFRGPEVSRPRTSKCVLEDVLEDKDVLKDSTSGYPNWQ